MDTGKVVHHHRVEGVTTASSWVGLGTDFGNPYIEAILSCVFTRTLNKIWDPVGKLNTKGVAAFHKLSTKEIIGDK